MLIAEQFTLRFFKAYHCSKFTFARNSVLFIKFRESDTSLNHEFESM